MDWIVNLVIFYAIAVYLWPEKRWKPVHVLWAAPAAMVGLMVLSVVAALVLR